MGALKFGLTFGLIGAVTGVFNLANDIPYLKALAAPGWFVATLFGKACIGTFLGGCSAKQVATTIVAVSVGNGLVYTIVGALIGLGFKSIFNSKSEPSEPTEQKTVVQIIQTPVKKIKDERPKSKALVTTKIEKK